MSDNKLAQEQLGKGTDKGDTGGWLWDAEEGESGGGIGQ